eukprot:5958913-Heterocapsa_arctica.AAC.1
MGGCPFGLDTVSRQDPPSLVFNFAAPTVRALHLIALTVHDDEETRNGSLQARWIGPNRTPLPDRQK